MFTLPTIQHLLAGEGDSRPEEEIPGAVSALSLLQQACPRETTHRSPCPSVATHLPIHQGPATSRTRMKSCCRRTAVTGAVLENVGKQTAMKGAVFDR